MSKLMSVLGVVLLAVGLVLGLLELMQPGRVQGLGISIGTAVDLIVGGILALGLGGVIAALRGLAEHHATHTTVAVPAALPDILVPGSSIGQAPVEVAPAPDVAAIDEAVAEEPAPSRLRFGFGKKLAATTAATVATAEAAKSPVQDTLDALEQAKQDIKGALGGMDAVIAPTPANDPAPPPAPEPEAVPAVEEELYVVEEKTIRGRPARILSDDTVEAETDEGWMRFENLEHLNEYLDAAG